jgi:M6 family metalloprotease-like protein
MNDRIKISKILWVLISITFFLSYARINPMTPPGAGEWEKYKKDGSLARRLEFAEKRGNNKVRPDLIARLNAKIQSEKQGAKIDLKYFPYPTGMPSKGSPKIFVLLIEFPDYPHTQDISRFQSSIFGDGDPNDFPYDSLRNFYYRSSYGQLYIQGDVMPWYMAPANRANYTADILPLIKEAMNAVNGSVDFAQYDNNGDGEIDYFICYWTGPDSGWSTTWWAWCDLKGDDFAGDPFTVDGKKPGVYSWVWEKNDGQNEPDFMPRVSIHETGHGLGLPDYYDYSNQPLGGLGFTDMMDTGWFDHCALSKWLLEWMSPVIISDKNIIHNITLRNFDSFGDAVVIMPGQNGTPFDEYFVVENRIYWGNDSAMINNTSLPREGFYIYHVNAFLNSANDNFQYNNSGSGLKLIRLEEGDGGDRIDNWDGRADAGDIYVENMAFSSATKPDSDSYYYSPNRNGVYVTNISPGWSTRSATFLNASTTIFAALNTALDNAELSFLTGGNSIWYGLSMSTGVNVNAARNSALSDGQNTWIKTTVSGQGTVSFDWKVSSQQDGDYLKFYIDDELIDYISGEVDWQIKSYRITKTGTGSHTLLWKYDKNGSGAGGQDCAWLDDVQFTPLSPTLGEALDNAILTWSAGGDNGWYGQTSTHIFGDSAAKSDTISDSQNTWLKTQVNGAGTLNFYWKTASESSADYLMFYIDGILKDQISGATDWIHKSFYIKTDGNHTLSWKYIKNGSGSAYSDCAWVDRVEFLPIDNLAEAVDNNLLEFVSGGTYKWVYQNYFAFYGGDAAQSGYAPANGESYFQTSVDAPGYLTFFWKVSSEQNYDYLEFCIDDVWQQRISGEQDWAMMNDIYISGLCTLKWRYKKDGSGISGYDAGWVDRISYNYSTSLSDALDNHYLPVKTFGDGVWQSQNSVYLFGGSAAKAGPVGGWAQKTYKLQTCLTGPGTLSFYWKASTEDEDYAPLTIFVDDVEQAHIGGIADWEQRFFTLTPGTHTILWTYETYGDTNENEDMVWLDKVQFIKNISLNEAIDNNSLVLDTYGIQNWYGVEDITAFCGASAHSGAIPDGYSSFLETSVNGPKNLSFNWKVSSEANKDYLEFYIDGAFKAHISGNTSWAQQNYLLAAGPHLLSWQYYKDGSGSTGSDCGYIDKVLLTSTPSIAEALDFTGFVWSTDGNAGWLGQTFTHYYDGDAAQSGDISGDQYSRLYTSITGPGLFSFYWKVSSQHDWDFLEFYIDGQKRNSISGEVDWQLKTYILESGDHLIEWKYSKNTAFDDGADCGWVDRIQWTPGIVPSCDIQVPYQYPTIQEAINAAREGCVIHVFPGTYYENITISGKNIILSSIIPGNREITEETIIDGSRNGPVITFGGDEYYTCKVAGFTIMNGLAENGGGIYGNQTLATIEDNIITSNTATVCGGGIWGTMGTVQRNRIAHNKADFAGGGLFRCTGAVVNNFIYGNFSANYGGGVSWCNGSFHNNAIYGNTAAVSGGGSYASNTQLKACIFWNNYAPEDPEIHYDEGNPPDPPLNCCIKDWTGPGTNTFLGDPGFVNTGAGNFHIKHDSSCIDNGVYILDFTDDIDRDTRPVSVFSRPRGVSHNDIGADEYKNQSPEITIIAPEGNEESLAKSYEIMWTVSDVNCEASTSIYLDSDNSGQDGTLIISGIKSINSHMTYIFEKGQAPEGIYYIYGILSDGYQPASYSYSPGTIKISRITREELIDHLLNRSQLESSRMTFADFNRDGIVDVSDLVTLLRI